MDFLHLGQNDMEADFFCVTNILYSFSVYLFYIVLVFVVNFCKIKNTNCQIVFCVEWCFFCQNLFLEYNLRDGYIIIYLN